MLLTKHKLPLGLIWLSITLIILFASVVQSDEDRLHVPSTMMVEETGEAAQYWPQWRGPSRQGLVTGDGYPIRWFEDEANSENILWKSSLKGVGSSSPVIWGDRIFITAQQDDILEIYCFERVNGSRIWVHQIPGVHTGHVTWKNNAAASTPVVDGNHLYVYFSKGVVALDFSGHIVWMQKLPEFEAKYYTATSPILHDGRLFLAHNGPAPASSSVMALDSRNGKIIWEVKRQDSESWSSPVIVRVDGADQLVVAARKTIEAFDPTTGEPIWLVRKKRGQTIPTPVVGNGKIFFSYWGNTLVLRPDGTGDITKSHVLKNLPKGAPFVPSPVLYKGRLYLMNDRLGIATAYDAETLRLLWQGRLVQNPNAPDQRTPTYTEFSSSGLALDGKIFWTRDTGQTYVLQAGDAFNVLHTNHLTGNVIASPALSKGRWYFRTDKGLVAIGHR